MEGKDRTKKAATAAILSLFHRVKIKEAMLPNASTHRFHSLHKLCRRNGLSECMKRVRDGVGVGGVEPVESSAHIRVSHVVIAFKREH